MAFEIRILLRRLLRNPSYVIPVVLIIALGSGALAAVAAFVNGGLLNAFPYPEPERINFVYASRVADDVERWRISGPEFVVLHGSGAFVELAAFGGGSFNMTGDGFPVRVRGLTVSTDFFRVFGLQPVLGRTFESADAGRADIVVVGEAFFRRELGGDPARLGTAIVLNGVARTVVGVVPERFRFIGSEVFVHSDRDPATMPPDRHALFALGRLHPDQSAPAAGAIVDSVLRQLAPEWRFDVRAITDNLERVAPSLRTLAAAVAILLVLMVANVAGLQLARFERQRGEVAIMMATGATAARVTRRWQGETVALFVVGAAIGSFGAAWLIEPLVALVPARAGGLEILPPEAQITLGWPLIVLTMASALMGALLVATIPAVQTRRLDLTRALHGARAGTRSRMYGALVMVQLVVTTALVAVAALVVQSHGALQSRTLGFSPDRVQTFQVSLPSAAYPDAASRSAFYNSVVEQLRTLPGVAHAGAVHVLPLEGFEQRTDLRIRGQTVSAAFNEVVPGYFETMGIPLVQGRFIRLADAANSEPVAVVNQTFASRHLNGDALGRTVVDSTGTERRIVGVIGDTRQYAITAPIAPEILFPYAQIPAPSAWSAVVVRGSAGVGELRAAVAAVDANVPLFAAQPLEETVRGAFGAYRLTRLLLVFFGASGLLLALTGVYGLLAHFVGHRRREFGVRAALGATRAQLSMLVVRRCASLLACGLLAGLAAAWGAERVIAGLLVDAALLDLGILLAVVGSVSLAALGAALPPIIAASKMDPALVLRQE